MCRNRLGDGGGEDKKTRQVEGRNWSGSETETMGATWWGRRENEVVVGETSWRLKKEIYVSRITGKEREQEAGFLFRGQKPGDEKYYILEEPKLSRLYSWPQKS